MNLLFIGDVVGEPGLRALRAHLPGLRESMQLDLVIANAENVAGGAGITAQTAASLFDLGIDVLTNGNHAWDKREALDFIKREPRLLRPHNYPAGTPGSGWYVAKAGPHRVGVLNLLGNEFMPFIVDCPFRVADETLAAKPEDVEIVLVDMHSESAIEKTAIGWYLNGRVSAVVGTHTHIPTADERVLPGGTAYITDVGMAGYYDSVVGLGIENSIKRLKDKLPAEWDTAEGPGTLCGVVIDIDEHTGKSRSIRRVALPER